MKTIRTPQDYFNTWGYKNRQYDAESYGLWQVRGEDPNCDMGGSHICPDLGTYEGKFIDVVAMAVNLPGFWAWGGGGDITAVNAPKIIKVDSSTLQQQAALREEKAQLEKRLAEIKGKLI